MLVYVIALPTTGLLFGYELKYLLWTVNFVLFIQMWVAYYLYFIDKPNGTLINIIIPNIFSLFFFISILINNQFMTSLHIILILFIIVIYWLSHKDYISNYNFISDKKFKS